jgi:hypothetical protein
VKNRFQNLPLKCNLQRYKAVGGFPFKNKEPTSSSSSSSLSSSLPVTELTLTVLGSLTAEVHDSPLSRCLRGKAALLAPALAVGRAADAAAVKGADRAAAYDARVAGYVRAAGAAAGSTAGNQSGGVHAAAAATLHAPAMRVTTGDLRVTLVTGGGSRLSSAMTSTASASSTAFVPSSLDAFFNAEEPSAAEATARAADAPWSEGVRLKVIQAAAVDFEAEDVSVDLPLAPGWGCTG